MFFFCILFETCIFLQVIDGSKKKKISNGVSEVSNKVETPKSKKSLVVNPFSDKKKRAKSEDENPSPKKAPKQIEYSNEAEDSDDDIMIVDEVVADNESSESEGGESDADEAEGDSDELDEDDSDSDNDSDSEVEAPVKAPVKASLKASVKASAKAPAKAPVKACNKKRRRC